MAQIDSQIKFLDLVGLGLYDTKIKDFINGKINALDFAIDNHTNGKPIVSVSLTDGKISVAEGNISGSFVDVTGAPAGVDGNVLAVVTDLYSKINNTAEAGVVAVYDGATKVSNINEFGKTYTFKQGTTTIATMNLAKDMVISGGSVITAESSDKAVDDNVVVGDKYIKLTIANSSDVLYIPVKDLVDVYTFNDGDEIDFTTNGNTITAAIKSGSIAESKLTDALKQKIAAAATTATAKTDGHVKVTVTPASGATPANIAITETDIASASDLSAEVTRAKAAEGEIAGKIGLTGNEGARAYSTSIGGATVVADMNTISTRLGDLETSVNNIKTITETEIDNLFTA